MQPPVTPLERVGLTRRRHAVNGVHTRHAQILNFVPAQLPSAASRPPKHAVTTQRTDPVAEPKYVHRTLGAPEPAAAAGFERSAHDLPDYQRSAQAAEASSQQAAALGDRRRRRHQLRQRARAQDERPAVPRRLPQPS